MTSRLDPAFVKQFRKLPARIQKLARENFKLWQSNRSHPSLEYKPVHPRLPIYSVRVGSDYRAVCVKRDDDSVLWFFIGSHAEYDKLLARL